MGTTSKIRRVGKNYAIPITLAVAYYKCLY